MSASDRGLAGWAASGAMALSGRSDGPPRAAPGDVTGALRDSLDTVARATAARTGSAPDLPGVQLLGERAAIAGLRRNGPLSCGGAFRMVPAEDGWFGLSLARQDDVDLVSALVEATADTGPWDALTAWAARTTRRDAAERALLLGLPHAAWPPLPLSHRDAVLRLPGGRRDAVRERPLVVDLSALWAGPLCAHLLAEGGCRVVKVEDRRRPDGARGGPPAFFDLLHHGHAMVSTDLSDPAEVDRLVELILRADLVIESSRPRALRQHGIDAAAVVAQGVSWLSITARGRASDAVGFGDDVAVAGGLAAPDGADVLPVGDALADPLTGARAAAAAARALLDEQAWLLDVSMTHVAAEAAAGEPVEHRVVRDGARWFVQTATTRHPVARPTARAPRGRAAALGHDDRRWPR